MSDHRHRFRWHNHPEGCDLEARSHVHFACSCGHEWAQLRLFENVDA